MIKILFTIESLGWINTAEEAMDSKWVIGSPTYLTVFLKYRSWLKTFSAWEIYNENEKTQIENAYNMEQ